MESTTRQGDGVSGRFTGCQVAALVGAVLFVAGTCVLLGMMVGGVTGYVLGRSASQTAGPPIQVPPSTWPPIASPQPPPMSPEERPYLGIRYALLDEGARIESVEPESPAEEAGLEPGDVIVAVDGEPVGLEARPLAALILSHHPGEVVRLTVERGEETLEVEVTLGRWSERRP
jgi:membrane-associated protease RseP (regulator of RpoE activity)